MNNFINTIKRLLSEIQFKSVLDIGCGEGVLMHFFKEYFIGKRIFGIDIDPGEIKIARKNVPSAQLMAADTCALPFSNKEFDLVLCCEVLEHVYNPGLAMQEIQRVGRRYCILTVPNEPVWRILNLVRGKDITSLGNTPGHINHWTSKSFKQYASSYFQILETVTPLPWTGLLCCHKDSMATLY